MYEYVVKNLLMCSRDFPQSHSSLSVDDNDDKLKRIIHNGHADKNILNQEECGANLFDSGV